MVDAKPAERADALHIHAGTQLAGSLFKSAVRHKNMTARMLDEWDKGLAVSLRQA